MDTTSAAKTKEVLIEDWGLIPYGEAWERQKAYVKQALHNLSEWQDRLILCEHPPVITLGRNADQQNILFSAAYLQKKGVEIYEVERGGDVTYHGPGQIVGYPILWLERFRCDVSWYMRSLEEVLIRTLADYGLKAERIPGLTGVWLLNPPRKIAALGVKLSRWLTMHGFALNINTDLTGFSYIVPCGIRDKAVTSLHLELGQEVPLGEVKEKVIYYFHEVFEIEAN
ncbi:MAG: lipoyl(octanoyl) transferase LipB [Bacteroidia bacterium]|nr:lipoyl(octanoyl) transferase LipB [Bacteroidia bacterium]MDW8135079.1 lipoyl(octanoyl) transferase LipB [Bacteroidia bacterium]